jgi:hypothetical protein
LVILAAVIAVCFASDLVHAKNRPTVDDPTGADCWLDSDADQDCSGNICSCCYDNGCWICNNIVVHPGSQDCHWDPAYRRLLRDQQRLLNAPSLSPLQPNRPNFSPVTKTPPTAR